MAAIKARSPPGMTGCPLLVDPHQDGITITINPEIDQRLNMT
jgi:hypothetical protein